jgi:hypothetical protein
MQYLMQSLKILTLSLLFTVLVSSSKNHDYYVSVTKIEYSENEKSLQIISQIFINDFEKLLRQRYNDTIILDTKNEAKTVKTYMQRYLSDKLKIKVNGKTVNFNFIGKAYKDDIVYCYLEVENVSKIQSIEVINRLLFDVYTEQQNIVKLKLNNKNKSFLLIPDNDQCVLNFD